MLKLNTHPSRRLVGIVLPQKGTVLNDASELESWMMGMKN
jgi:hypothetical protein